MDIHRQRFSKSWRMTCRIVLSSWGNYRELTVNLRICRAKHLQFFILHTLLYNIRPDNFFINRKASCNCLRRLYNCIEQIRMRQNNREYFYSRNMCMKT